MRERLESYKPSALIKTFRKSPPEFFCRTATADRKAVDIVWTQQVYRRRRDAFHPKPDEVWLDLGSHIGAFSVLAHRYGADVVAVEAHPDNVKLTRANLERNGLQHPTILSGAVVPDEFRRDMVDLHCTGSHRRNSIARSRRTSTALPVPALKMTQLVDEFRPDGVKMSVEGAEIQILHSWEIPEFVRYTVVEWNFATDNRLHTLASGFERLASRYRNVDMSRKPDISKRTHDGWPRNIYLYGWD